MIFIIIIIIFIISIIIIINLFIFSLIDAAGFSLWFADYDVTPAVSCINKRDARS